MKRKTQQRTAIQRVFREAREPLSPQDVQARAAQYCPGVGIATVYRAIRELVADRQIVSVEVAGKPPLYERADLDHHHHFHCERCGEVTPLQGCSIAADYRLPRGFKVSSHEVLFSGICPLCRNA